LYCPSTLILCCQYASYKRRYPTGNSSLKFLSSYSIATLKNLHSFNIITARIILTYIMAIKFSTYFKRPSSTKASKKETTSSHQNSEKSKKKDAKKPPQMSNTPATSSTAAADKKKVKVVRVSFINTNGSTFQMN